jgi:DNA repair protein SbcC/Rad50
MRVLAIRGRNIASLADPFEIDLQREPLASASLYTIAGPTGAGKSSLLDALCLALYDLTPRTAAAPARGGELPDGDSGQMSARDARQLLHRGATEAYAEVDFVGVDRVAYRARWSVRRAHGKRDGRLQKSQLSLHRLPELVPVADVGNKVEALDAIRARVGLDYRQFTRAVLLAQNEFAAFLRADQDERAQLLQTLTGTEQFERLSIAAYQRARHEASRLELLQQQLLANPILSEADRQALERLWEDARGRRDEVREQLSQLRQWQHWQHQQIKLDSALAEAAAALDQSLAAQEQAAPRRRELDRMRLLHPLREPWRRSTELARQATQLSAGLEQARKALDATQLRDQTAQQQLDSARQTSQQQRTRAEALAPELKQAEQLDDQIARQTESIEQHRRTHDQLQQELNGQAQQLAADEARQGKLRSTLERLQAELQARSAESWLLRPDQSWRDELAQLQRLRKADEAAASEQQQARTALTGLLQQQNLIQAEVQSVAREQAAAQEAQSDCEARLQDARFDQLPARLAEVHDRIQSHTARAFDLRRRLDLEGERSRRAERGRLADQSLATIELRMPELESTVRAAEAARVQAEAALEAAQLAAGLSAVALRDTLQDEQPCPVCGSRDHPYADPQQLLADHGPRGDANEAAETTAARSLQQLLDLLQQQRARTQSNEQARRDELAAMRAQAEAARTELQRLRQEDAATQPQLQTLLEALRADPQAGELLALASAELESELHARQTALQAEATELAGLEQQRSQAAEALRASNQVCKTIAARLGELEQRIAGANGSIDQASQRLTTADTERRLQQLKLEQHCAGIDKWLQPLGSQASELDLDVLQERLEQRAANRRAGEQQREELERELGELDRALPRLRGLIEARQGALAESSERLQTLLELDQQLRDRRRLLLQGETVATARAGQEQASREAEAALGSAMDNAQNARVERAQAQTRIEQIEQQRGQIESALSKLREDLRLRWRDLQSDYAELAEIDPSLAARLFDEQANDSDAALHTAQAELDAALAIGQSELDQEQAALASIDEAMRMAVQAHSLRQQAIQSHAGDQPASQRPTEIEQALEVSSAELAQIEERLSGYAAERVRDDQSRQQASDLATAIATQSEISRRWGQLNLLIGSADGKKFRNLAQRRSLNLLLRHGNLQLRLLGSRYSLRPLKDQLNFLLVDQDLGGELRSVHSLSGGESFLVSLALALALAHLSSQQLAIESLFVDEGFGSLDEDTLNIAMQALDRLQAQGRKVGVISHLRELTERIGVQIEVQPERPGCSRVVVRQA